MADDTGAMFLVVGILETLYSNLLPRVKRNIQVRLASKNLLYQTQYKQLRSWAIKLT